MTTSIQRGILKIQTNRGFYLDIYIYFLLSRDPVHLKYLSIEFYFIGLSRYDKKTTTIYV
jgi:hypothetical protein